jgi:hypothetical protein
MSESTPTSADGALVYPASSRRLIVLAGLSLAFVAAGIYLLDAARRGDQPPVAGFVGIVGVAFFGACGAWALRRLATREPLLTADHDGLRDNGSAVGAGLLRWDEIAHLEVYRFLGNKMLGITPVDLDAVLPRIKRWRRAAARANVALGAPPFNVPQSTSVVPLERALDEILQRFGHRLPRPDDPGPSATRTRPD